MLGPPSLVANFTSNALFHGLRRAEDHLASLWDKARVKIFHGNDQSFRENFHTPMTYRTQAYRHALGEAWPRMLQDHTDILFARPLEIRPGDIGSFTDVNLQRYGGAIPGKAGEFLRSSFKSLESADQFFKKLTEWNELYDRAHTAGRRLGKSGEALQKFVTQRVDDMRQMASDETFAGKLKTASPDVYDQFAKDWALIADAKQRDTFQGPLQGLFRTIAQATQDHKFLQLFLPFVKTPSNIALETIRRTPMGLFLLSRRYAEVKGQRKGLLTEGDLRGFQQEITKPLLGTAIAGAMMAIAAEGSITGGGPTDPELEQTLRASGWQPYSVRIGDQWISYQRLEPLSSILGMAADVAEGWKVGDFDKTSTASKRLFGSITENLTNKTFLAGLEGLFTAWHDPLRYGGRLIQQLQGSLVPNVLGYVPVGQLARAIDPTIRKVEPGTLDPFKAKIPGVSKGLPAQYAPTGEERRRPGTIVERLASPLARTREKAAEGDVAREMVRIGYPPGRVPTTLTIRGRKVQLTTEEHAALMGSRREATAALQRVIRDPSYRALPDNDDDPRWSPGRRTKRDVIERIYSRYLQRAKAQVNPAAFARARQESRGAVAP
jgi:hypothetical protein